MISPQLSSFPGIPINEESILHRLAFPGFPNDPNTQSSPFPESRERQKRKGREEKLILMCGLLIQIPEKYQGVKGKMSSLQRASRGGAWEGNAAPSICSEHGAGAGSCCRSWWIRALPGARSCSRKFLWELPFQGMFPAMSTSAGNAEGAPSGPS